MKSLKCESCAGIWMVEDADLEKQKVCPYCTVSIQGDIEFSEYDSLDKAIFGAVSQMGKGVLMNPRQLCGFMLDTAPGLRKEIRIFSKTVNEDYVGYIKSAFEQEVEDAEVTINKLHHLFIEEEGLSDNWADMLCTGLYGAILYTKGVGTTRIINVEIEDFTIVQNSDGNKTLSGNMSSKTRANEKTDDTDKYDILKNYKCLTCGYVIDGFDLEYGDGEECPVCGAIRWKVTDELVHNNVSETLGTTTINNTYDSSVYQSTLDTAERYLSSNRIEDALEQYRQVANKGYIPAYISIADIYYQKKNYKKAWKWYLKAAEEEDSIGQYYVGYFYQEGLHVQKNTHLAVKYYEKAVNQGLPQAIMAIADCYNNGIGYKKDVQKALEYYKRLADEGYADAQYRLGVYFQNGEGGQKDVMQAVDWYQKAYLQGHARAKTKLDKCIAEMPLTQRLKWNLQKR